MNILTEIKGIQEDICNTAKLVDKNKFSLMENILAAGFIHEGNTYLGLFEELKEAINKPVKNRNPMFKNIEDWIPSLEYYINLLKEEKKFYEEVYKKQQEENLKCLML